MVRLHQEGKMAALQQGTIFLHSRLSCVLIIEISSKYPKILLPKKGP